MSSRYLSDTIPTATVPQESLPLLTPPILPNSIRSAAPVTAPTTPERPGFFSRVGNWFSNKDNLEAAQQRAQNTQQSLSNLEQITANIRDTFNPQQAQVGTYTPIRSSSDNMKLAIFGVAALGGFVYLASQLKK